MNSQQKIILVITLTVCALMAYFLRDLVRAIFFEPISYLWYAFSLMYLSVAQVVFWILLIAIVSWIALGSLYGKSSTSRSLEERPEPRTGPIERLAKQLGRGKKGMYYKWLVANRLGRLARAMVSHWTGKEIARIDRMDAPGWNPPADVRSYLESGLAQTFADYPRRKWFQPPKGTPFDTDIVKVITFLETKMEDRHD